MSNRHPDRWGTVQIPQRVAARAASKYEVVGDHWISTYSLMSTGYAQIGWRDSGEKTQVVLAHRASWVHHYGQIPVGMTVDHECKTKSCVRPDHLRLLPNLDNARRQNGQDWPLGQCKHGHPHEEYWHVNNSGGYCRACNAIWQKRYQDKKKAAT